MGKIKTGNRGQNIDILNKKHVGCPYFLRIKMNLSKTKKKLYV